MTKLVSAAALAVFAPVMSLSLQAEAQTLGNYLRGLSKLGLLVEDLDNDSVSCGLNKELVRKAVTDQTSSSAKFEVQADEWKVAKFDEKTFAMTMMPSLYVNIQSLYFESRDLCVTSIDIGAYSNQKVTLDFSHRRTFASVKLWWNGSLISSTQAEHSHHVAQEVRVLSKGFHR
jgi:hypothetical protein